MKNRIVLRVDGNSTIGFGHVYRSLALFQMLRDSFRFEIVSRFKEVKNIIGEELKFVEIPEHFRFQDEVSWFADNYDPRTTVLVLDGYDFQLEYQIELRNRNFSVVIINDLPQDPTAANILINHCPGLSVKQFKSVTNDTIFALGLEYTLIRPPFLSSPKEKIANSNDITKVFLCMGGADPLGLNNRVLNILSQIKEIKEIHVIQGSKDNSIYENKGKDVSIIGYKNLGADKLIHVMDACNLAVVSSSTVLFECVWRNLNVLTGYYVSNQQEIYKGFVEKGYAVPLGELQSQDDAQLMRSITSGINTIKANQTKSLRDQQPNGGRVIENFRKLFTLLK